MTVTSRLGTKICTRCDARKSLSEFGKDDRKRDGRQSWCLSCQGEQVQATRGIRARDIAPVHRSPIYSKDDGRDIRGVERHFGGPAMRTGLGPMPAPHKSASLAAQIEPIPCPCCSTPMRVPTLEVILFHYGVKPQEERIFRAVWAGRGLPVTAEKIFDAMYADDPDGGPGPAKMYSAFKESLHRLRRRLEGSGIGIECPGYRAGYRLVMGVAQKEK